MAISKSRQVGFQEAAGPLAEREMSLLHLLLAAEGGKKELLHCPGEISIDH